MQPPDPRDRRPDPDALLRRLNRTEGPARGRLKVFFGAAPGVGKTYAMLEAARRKRDEGLDVIIGWVETHGRAETAALAEGLEVLPARQVDYRGVSLREFDPDAALRRKPALVLLDELAHTNAAGSRHPKRWQDVEDLRDAGIDVYTTLNVQHLESQNDLVAQVTGVVVRETVPDRVLDGADEVEFVDLPPDDLLRRLSEGKVYVPERAAQAVHSFFRRGNLLALRELALRRTAEHVDADVSDYRRDHEIAETWPVGERLLVCVRPNPESDRLVRAARRMAARLKAPWIVAFVESPAQPPSTAEERRSLAATLRLAEELGAETAALSGENVADALLAFARQRNVTRIVLGKPAHSRWRDRLRGSLLDEIIRGSRGLEVMVVPGGSRPGSPAPRSPKRGEGPRPYLHAVASIALCTVVSWAMHGRFDNSNLVMIYLLGVAAVAARHGRRPSALAAVLGVAAFDFCFVPPYLTFAVADTQHLVTFAIMLTVSLLISTLSARVRAQAEAWKQREQRTRTLYDMSRDLGAARTQADVAAATSQHVSQALRGASEVLLPAAGRLEAPGSSSAELAVATWAFEHGRIAGQGTETLPGSAGLYLPLRGADAVLGVLAVRPDPALLPLAPDQIDLLESLAQQAASALERVRLAGEAEQARVVAESERLRSTLLSSVSHDLRTPLGAITGAASSLLGPTPLGAGAERELKEAILVEAERLGRFVTNLLGLTRLEAGPLQLHRDWESVEEIVGTALTRLERALAGHPVNVSLPEDLPLVPVDAVLVEQAIVNLLENAAKYAGAGTPISVAAWAEDGHVAIEVADEGPGLPAGVEERVFEKFYRGSTAHRGFGLGLPICRAIAEAHGGRATARTREPHGAAFRITLPLGAAPPPLAGEA